MPNTTNTNAMDATTLHTYNTLRKCGYSVADARMLALEGAKARHAMGWIGCR
jgi:hypothetical protein